MACPFTDLRRAPHCARPEPLDSRALIRVHGLDVEVLADELVIVLSVRDRRLEQFAPIARDRPRRKSQDSSRLVNRLAADVVTHQARLARRRADVLGLRPDDRRRQIGIAPAPSPPRRRLRRLLRLGLSGLAPRAPPTPLRSSRSPTLRPSAPRHPRPRPRTPRPRRPRRRLRTLRPRRRRRAPAPPHQLGSRVVLGGIGRGVVIGR